MSEPDKRIGRVITPSSEPTLIAGADGDVDPDATLVSQATVAAAPRPAPIPLGAILGQSGNALRVGSRISEFEVTGLVGEGGFGIVYRATDHSLERPVALKEYMPSSLATRLDDLTVRAKSLELTDPFNTGLRSFVNEARLLAQFDHPALVKVFRFWEANGTAYMVMPLYQGITLKQAMKRRATPPDEAELRRLLVPLLDALEVVHRANCFHRDVAPDNILLVAEDRPVLLDFGAARRVIGDMTQTLTVILKPGYAPIEQYGDSGDSAHFRQGAWTDLYALGALLHYCIMGKPPPPAIARSIKDIHPPLTETAAGRYSKRFLAAIDRALAPLPDERPQSVAEFRAELGIEAAAPRPVEREAPRAAPRLWAKADEREAPRAAPRTWAKADWVALAGGVIGIAVAGVIAYTLMGPSSPGPVVAPVTRESPPPKAIPEPKVARPEPSPSREPSIAKPTPPPTPAAVSPPAAASGSSPVAAPAPAAPAPTPVVVSPPPAAPASTPVVASPAPPIRVETLPREWVEPPKPPVTVAVPEKKPAAAPAAGRPRGTTGLQSSERCVALINQAQLGEPMSAAELEYLKRECR